jgi:hypothetical protein
VKGRREGEKTSLEVEKHIARTGKMEHYKLWLSGNRRTLHAHVHGERRDVLLIQ